MANIVAGGGAHRRILRPSVVAVIALYGATLGAMNRCNEMPSQAQLGSTHVAVLSATPWEDYRSQLSPSYGLEPKDALKAVLPDTVQLEQSVLDAFRAKAGLQLAPSAVLDPGFAAPGEVDPGRTSAGTGIPEPSAPQTRPAGPADAKGVVDAAKLGVDPFLQYWAATALYQEVKLLERYVQDAVQRDGYRAYIVRLQVTVMPYQRDHAFDTYANISFFADPVQQMPKTDGDRVKEAVNAQSDLPSYSINPELPVVVPLLVTDQVEAAIVSQRAEQLRQLSFALAAAYAGIGGKVDLDKLDQAVRSSLGRDYNSLYTVGRLADNTIRVQIGARHLTPTGGVSSTSSAREREYQTLKQTHNISLLLLVPDQYPDDATQTGRVPVYVGMRTEYRDPATGELAVESSQSDDDVKAGVRAILKSQGVGAGPMKVLEPSLYTMATSAQNGQYKDFVKLFGAVTDAGKFTPNAANVRIEQANAIWSSLVAARLGAGADVTECRLPYYPLAKAPAIESNQAFIVDDGAIATAVIDGVSGLDPLKVSAVWELKTPSRDVVLAASNAVIRGRQQLVLTFPSLLKTKLIRHSSEGPGSSFVTVRYPVLMNYDGSLRKSARLEARASFALAEPVNTVKVTANKKRIVLDAANPSTGTVRLAVIADGPLFKEIGTLKANELLERLAGRGLFTLAAEGATIADPAGAVIKRETNSHLLYIAGTGEVELTLKDLVPGKIKLIVSPPKGQGDDTPLEFDVVTTVKEPPAAQPPQGKDK